MISLNVLKIGAAASALFFAVPSMAQTVDQTYPAPAAQAVYPPCSSTVMDQCTNTRREADVKASTYAMDSAAMPMRHKHHSKKHMKRHMKRHMHHKM